MCFQGLVDALGKLSPFRSYPEFQYSALSAGVAERSAISPAYEGGDEIADSHGDDAWDMRKVSVGYSRRTLFLV